MNLRREFKKVHCKALPHAVRFKNQDSGRGQFSHTGWVWPRHLQVDASIPDLQSTVFCLHGPELDIMRHRTSNII